MSGSELSRAVAADIAAVVQHADRALALMDQGVRVWLNLSTLGAAMCLNSSINLMFSAGMKMAGKGEGKWLPEL